MSDRDDPIQSGNTIKTVYKHYNLYWNPHGKSVVVVVKSVPPSTFVVTKEKAIEMLGSGKLDIHYQLLYSEILELCRSMEEDVEDRSANEAFHLQKIKIEKYLKDTDEGA